ncbi:MAG: ADP-ribosylglycohydrolase family protein, partial [Brachybacterium sp.]|nr:ADP-ribosylglycohydrolase family protein [Brachybacterium sp.]
VEHAQSDERSLPQGADFRQAALDAHAELSLSAGNGALMRTHVVAIAHLHSEDDVLHEAVVAVSSLTHVHTESLDACVLWAFAVREAILTGRLDVRAGIDRLPEERAREWALRLEEAETAEPSVFARNGWAVHALQAAWSAIHGAGPLPEGKFAQRALLTDVLERAVRAGNDTDTVACIAGALMGAALGYKAVQPEWRRRVFGWPGMELADLMGLVDQVLGVPEDPGSTLASVATVTVASPPSPAAP